MRPLPALPPPHARHRGDGLSRDPHRRRRLSRWPRPHRPRRLVGIAVAIGWLGVYFGYRQSWLGLVLPLTATALVVVAIRQREMLTRSEQSALHHALTAAAARNRELERLRHLAAKLLGGSDLTELVREVRQVLFNLLSNASKFTPEGGSITLRALPTQAPLPQPADRAGDEPRMMTRDVVWVAVSDTGVGIRPEDIPKLFLEFSQADSSASRQAQGTGLGLALYRKFVELHGGTIGADSVPGRGTTFWFILPTNGPTRRRAA